MSVAVIQAFNGGMGFESLPPLPIILETFGFLKCVNLSLVGLGLNEILFDFGWDLVVWKPILKQSKPKGALGSSEVHIEVVDVVDDLSPSQETLIQLRQKQGLSLFLSRVSSEQGLSLFLKLVRLE